MKRVVVFDLDGVLCDTSAQIAGMDRESPDWHAFHTACGDSPAIEGWRAMVALLHEMTRTPPRGAHTKQPHKVGIVILTNRPNAYRELTVRWLRHHRIPYDMLLMRSEGAHYAESKRHHVTQLQLDHQILFAVDDDPMHGEMYAGLGVPFVYAHSGYYDAGRMVAAGDTTVYYDEPDEFGALPKEVVAG